MSGKGSNTKSQQENKGDTKAANVTLAMLLEEAWDSYLAAKRDGTPAQRSAALKAVYEQLLLQRKQDEGQTLDRFEMMDDAQLLAEVKRLLEKLSSTLGIKIEPAVHEPANHEPAVHEPANHEPAVHEPANHEPAVHEPANHEPAVHEE